MNDKSLTFDNKLKTKSFEKCLQKLWALVDIDIDFNVITDGEVLRIIAENCHHLRRLSIRMTNDMTDESIQYFGQKCGKRLKYLSIRCDSEEQTRLLLSFITELVSLKRIIHFKRSYSHSMFLSENKSKLLPKLQEIDCNFMNGKN